MWMEHYMTEIGSVALSQDGKEGTPTEQNIVSQLHLTWSRIKWTDILLPTPVTGNGTSIRKLLSRPPRNCSVPPTLHKTDGQEAAYFRNVHIVVFRENFFQYREAKMSDINWALKSHAELMKNLCNLVLKESCLLAFKNL